MKRRELIGGVAASAVAWPLRAWAQQSTLPVIGMLNGQSAEGYSHLAEAVRLGLPTARPPKRSFHLVFESHDGTAYVPIPARARERHYHRGRG